MVEDQGEVAVLLEVKDDKAVAPNILGYTLPKNRDFRREELQNAFLAAYAGSDEFVKVERKDRDVLQSHLCNVFGQKQVNAQFDASVGDSSSVSKEENESVPHSVFAGTKYKPVALKVKPVLGELPTKYRIERNKPF